MAQESPVARGAGAGRCSSSANPASVAERQLRKTSAPATASCARPACPCIGAQMVEALQRYPRSNADLEGQGCNGLDRTGIADTVAGVADEASIPEPIASIRPPPGPARENARSPCRSESESCRTTSSKSPGVMRFGAATPPARRSRPMRRSARRARGHRSPLRRPGSYFASHIGVEIEGSTIEQPVLLAKGIGDTVEDLRHPCRPQRNLSGGDTSGRSRRRRSTRRPSSFCAAVLDPPSWPSRQRRSRAFLDQSLEGHSFGGRRQQIGARPRRRQRRFPPRRPAIGGGRPACR